MLSIIIPTYNEEKVIESMLKRLRDNPPTGEYEIIVSDQSTDKTPILAKPLADKVVIEPRSTIARGRNAGAAAARGDLLVFADAGIEIPNPPAFFAKLTSLFAEDPNLVGATVKIGVYPKDLTAGIRFSFWLTNSYYAIMNNFLHWGSALGKFQMIRASAFKKIGGYNEKIVVCEDQDMFIRLAKIGRTHSELSLEILHEPRRQKRLGWARVLLTGMLEGASVQFFRRSISKEWTAIR